MGGLTLNFIQYELSHETIPVKYLPNINYQSKEEYLKLKESHPDLIFYRQGDKIFYWETQSGVQSSLIGTSFNATSINNPKIVSKITEEALIKFLKTLNSYKITKNSHSHSWDLVSSINLFEGILDGLKVFRCLSINPYFVYSGGKLQYGFTFSMNLKFQFHWSLEDFKSRGIDTLRLTVADDNTTIIPSSTSVFHFLSATGQQGVFESKKSEIEDSEQTLKVINQTVAWISKNLTKIYLPGHNSLKKIDLKYLPHSGMYSEQLPLPKRYFFGGATNTKGLRNYNEMVKEYKPSSFGLFEEKRVSIGLLFPAEFEGVTEVFFKKIENILKNDLHLKGLIVHPIKINGSDLKDYEKGIYQDSDLLKNIDLFVIVVSEEHESLAPNMSPYFFCKAKLLGDGIPTQDIQIETMKKRLHDLALNNIALNIYAKLGGTAWTIEKEEKAKEELVIGVGSTVGKDGKSVIGLTQVFHSDGRYIVGDCSPLTTFENYAEVLEEYLFNALNDVISGHINKEKPFRLIFHLFKSAGQDNEIRAIENVTKRLKDFKFDFALVHLGYGHNFRLYNNDGKSKVGKGTYIKLDSYSGLLHFGQENPIPLKIELDKRSVGFSDLFYLSKQVFWFSSLSHRNYMPAKRTVTIMYPSLMAAMTEKLSQVPNWNYDRLKFVSEKLWFI